MEAGSDSSTPSSALEAASPGRPEGGPLGWCALSFCLATAFGVVGSSVLVAGAFAHVGFFDLLIYAGVFCVLFSLVWRVCWYVADPEAPQGDGDADAAAATKEDPAGGRGLRGRVRDICLPLATICISRDSTGRPTVTLELENA